MASLTRDAHLALLDLKKLVDSAAQKIRTPNCHTHGFQLGYVSLFGSPIGQRNPRGCTHRYPNH